MTDVFRRFKGLNIREALDTARKILADSNIVTPAREAGVLLAFTLGKDLSYIYAHPEQSLENGILHKFMDAVEKRSKRMPFQYISNRQEFMSLDFYVDQNCLVPRPETEILTEAAIGAVKKYTGTVRVLDIGTGSGAIAVSIAYYAPDAEVDAIDISEGALHVAAQNAKRHNVFGRVNFIHADINGFSAVKPYRVIVSNPPYIPSREIENLMPEVACYEPVTALDGGEDGLYFYRIIGSKLKELLTPDGTVLVEVGAGQHEYVREIFEKNGMRVSVLKDLAGTDRVVLGTFGNIFP